MQITAGRQDHPLSAGFYVGGRSMVFGQPALMEFGV